MKAIRKYRELKNLSQAELAALCNVVPSTVSMWETGARMPDLAMLKTLAKIFSCSADDLLVDIKEKGV